LCSSGLGNGVEVSQDWQTNLSFAEDGSVVEIVLLEARTRGAYPAHQQKVA